MSKAEIARIKWALKKHDDACNLRGSPEDILEDDYVDELRKRVRAHHAALEDKYKNHIKERQLAKAKGVK